MRMLVALTIANPGHDLFPFIWFLYSPSFKKFLYFHFIFATILCWATLTEQHQVGVGELSPLCSILTLEGKSQDQNCVVSDYETRNDVRVSSATLAFTWNLKRSIVSEDYVLVNLHSPKSPLVGNHNSDWPKVRLMTEWGLNPVITLSAFGPWHLSGLLSWMTLSGLSGLDSTNFFANKKGHTHPLHIDYIMGFVWPKSMYDVSCCKKGN